MIFYAVSKGISRNPEVCRLNGPFLALSIFIWKLALGGSNVKNVNTLTGLTIRTGQCL